MKEAAVLAIDAGGSRSRALLCSQEGCVLAYSEGGACNYHSSGVEKAVDRLTKLLAALTAAEPIVVSYAVFALAGLDTPADQVKLLVIVKRSLERANIVANKLYIDNDAMLTLKGAVGPESGVLVIAGTGSISCGIHQDGRTVRVGGWGYRVGDEGSGYAIGKAALTHILRVHDGREESSAIARAILAKLALVDGTSLANWVYSDEFSVQRVAALAPLVLKLAGDNDFKAGQIISAAGRELSELAVTAIRRLALQEEKIQVVLKGGLMQNQLLRQQLQSEIVSQCAKAEVATLEEEPILLVLCYALRSIGAYKPSNRGELLQQVTQKISSFSC